MTQAEYLGWLKYWTAEPWGPYRDNLHAALIAREVRRPQMRKGAKVELDDFMVMDPVKRRQDASRTFIGFLKSIAKPGARRG